MAYQINKTDGTIVATVADGQVDTLSTDLTLIGKNYSGFGEALNENFIKLLENFSTTATPTHPIRGQIWFDTSESKLKVYNGTAFIPVSSATIANTQPSTLGIGDLWFSNSDAQLYFFDGTSPILLGPAYSSSQSLSGIRVDSVLDTLNQTRVITSLYNNGILLGIFAKDSFTPKNAIVGFSGNINPGFTAGDLSGLKFYVTVTNSEQLGGVPSTTYIRNDTTNSLSGLLQITVDDGITIGSADQFVLQVTNGNLLIANSASNKNITLRVIKDSTSVEDAMTISSSNRTIDFYEGFSDSEITVGGNLTVVGNLTIEGTTTTVNTSTLTVEDKNIELAAGATTNSEADGGGITLRGATDHTLVWTEASTAWNSSEHVNLAVNKEFKINGITVLSGTSLGSGITAIPGVTSFGKQTVVNIGPGSTGDPAYLRLQDNNISTITGNLDIELEPDGTGNVALIGSPRITGLQNPVGQQDASTKEYVDNRIETRNLFLSIDLSDGKPNSYIITNILNKIFPEFEYNGLTGLPLVPPVRLLRTGTIARILCTGLVNNTVSLDLNTLLAAGKSTATFNTPTGTASAVTNYSIATATVPAASITATRIIKEFYLSAGGWTWVSDTPLPP
jgi:hypothetical protein